jgi:hypothetical protein
VLDTPTVYPAPGGAVRQRAGHPMTGYHTGNGSPALEAECRGQEGTGVEMSLKASVGVTQEQRADVREAKPGVE